MDNTFIIRRADLTPNGSLTNLEVRRIKEHLLKRDLVLLPSDTGYSLAICAAFDKKEYDQINIILNRKDEPISIAFPSVLVAESFINLDRYSRILLERFTPGPITVVCKVTSRDIKNQKIVEVVRSKDETVGVRISDSQIERQVAGSTNYPITTVAIRDKDKKIIQDFSTALQRVQEGIKKLKQKPQIIAIEGDKFAEKHSTVVKLDSRANCTLIRPGAIDFEKINQALRFNYPQSGMED